MATNFNDYDECFYDFSEQIARGYLWSEEPAGRGAALGYGTNAEIAGSSPASIPMIVSRIVRLLWFPVAVALELLDGFKEMYEEVLEDRPVPRKRR